MINTIIYIRVSDPSQIDNISFDVQTASCEKYAKEQGWKVIKVFKEEGESAKFADRTKLKELIEYSRINKGKINVCLVYKIDRFARNQVDHYAIKARLLEYGVSVRSATEPVDDTPIGKVVEGLFAAVAQLDNDLKSQRVKEAMRSWVLKGRWVWGAKFGYLNKKDSTDHALILIDPIKGPLVTELFRKFSTGQYTYKALADELNKRLITGKKGKPIHPQGVQKLLKDKFYIKIIEMYGEETEGLHDALTDPNTFYKCQEIIAKRSNNASNTRETESIDFPLRGRLLCSECGEEMTAAWCAGRTQKYPYYYCVKKGCPNKSKSFKRNDVHNNFYDLLGNIKPNDDCIELFKEMFIKVYRQRVQELEGDTLRIKAEIQQLDSEKTRIIEMGKKRLLTDEEFGKELSEIRDKLAVAQLTYNETRTDESEINVCLAYAQNFVRTANQIWFDAPSILKIKLQAMIFPTGVKYDFDSISNRDLSLPFKLNRDFAKQQSLNVTRRFVPSN